MDVRQSKWGLEADDRQGDDARAAVIYLPSLILISGS